MKKAYCLGTALGCLLTMAAWAQQTSQSVPLDRTAVERTHVPHENPNMWGAKSPTASAKPGSGGSGGGGKPGGGGGGGGTFTGTPYSSVGAVKNATTSAPGAEEHIAIDPTTPNNLVAAISDFSQRGGYNTTKYAYSYDGGTAWGEHFVQFSGSLLQTGDGLSWDANSDPVVAIDRASRVYLANLYFNATNGNSAGGLYVSVGSLGAANLGISAATTYGVSVQSSPTTSTAEDKEWIAVDNSGGARNGAVYVSWTRFTSTDMILFSSSADHGVHWSAPKQVSNPAHNGAVQGSQIAVGPGGEIYVVYEVYYVGSQRAHFLTKSTDGGANFSAPVQITPLFGELKFNSTYRKNSFSALAVGPTGTVYVTYADQPSRGSSQIRFIKSTNGGSTFSSPVSVNDSSTGQRLMPSVAADSTGIHFSWFDTRNASGSTARYDIYATRSDDGSAFSPNQKVTPTTINAGSASFIGDYGGIAASSGYAHPVWTSGGFNGGVLQTATLH